MRRGKALVPVGAQVSQVSLGNVGGGGDSVAERDWRFPELTLEPDSHPGWAGVSPQAVQLLPSASWKPMTDQLLASRTVKGTMRGVMVPVTCL